MSARLIAYFRLMRFHRPWPILLILLPTYWGLFLGPGKPTFNEWVIFTLGAVLARAGGCVINDYFDRNIDGKVKRTRERPLQQGLIKPHEAIGLFLILMLLAFLCLLFLKVEVILTGIIAFLLVLVYPLSKRFTYFPQVILGMAFNFGLIMANLQVNGHISSLAVLWYLFSILWTIHYDTLYALADYQDDLKIGVKSIATFFKARVYAFLALTSLLLMVGLFFIWGIQGISITRSLILLALMAFLGMQYLILLREREQAGMKLFIQHIWFGALVLLGILL